MAALQNSYTLDPNGALVLFTTRFFPGEQTKDLLEMKLGLQQLLEFAHIVDKYKVHHAVKAFGMDWCSKLWAESEEKTLQGKASKETTLAWLSITLVLGTAESFALLTDSIIKYRGNAMFNGLDSKYRIPGALVDAIKKARASLASEIKPHYLGLVHKYRTTSVCQDATCDSFVLGNLENGPKAGVPLLDVSEWALQTACSQKENPGSECTIKLGVHADIIRGLINKNRGLKLEDFKAS